MKLTEIQKEYQAKFLKDYTHWNRLDFRVDISDNDIHFTFFAMIDGNTEHIGSGASIEAAYAGVKMSIHQMYPEDYPNPYERDFEL